MCPSTMKYLSPLLSYKATPHSGWLMATEPVINRTGSVGQHLAT
jgi:hypothetical protein